MKRTIVLAGILAMVAGAVVAQDDPIKARKDLMKRNGDAMRILVPMTRGEQPFNAEAALAALQVLAQDAQDFDHEKLFPAGSESGGDTKAAPKIWEDRDGFVAAIEKFRTDSAAAVSANPQDVAALQAAVGQVGQNCGACHEAYRIKTD